VHQWFCICHDANLLQVQHNPESSVNAAHLFETEIAYGIAQSTRIDGRGLFSQHPRDAAIDLDLGPKACGPG
jgi:hypothetical protein